MISRIIPNNSKNLPFKKKKVTKKAPNIRALGGKLFVLTKTLFKKVLF